MVSRFAAIALVATVLSVAALAAPSARAEGDAERGRKLAYTCHGCHGIENYRNAYPNYPVPKLGGQNAAYLTAALAEYGAKARWHPTMQGIAATLLQQDIEDIAAFFQGPVPATGGEASGTPPAAVQTCAACHGTYGIGVLAEYPTLAGQHAEYLEQALKDYRSGKRQQALMGAFAGELMDADIEALAAWYATRKGLYTPSRR